MWCPRGSVAVITATPRCCNNARLHLIVVGTADDAQGGTDIVALRLAPFDGIFRNGFEPAVSMSSGPYKKTACQAVQG